MVLNISKQFEPQWSSRAPEGGFHLPEYIPFVQQHLPEKKVPGVADAFLLVGHRKSSPLVGLGVIYDFFDAGSDDSPDAEEDSEDLDFAMT